MAEEFAAGAATVAFGTLGDPNLYSTFSYLAQTVRDLVPEVTVETVAGITAMQDLASRAGISLAEGTEPVTLVPLNGGVERSGPGAGPRRNRRRLQGRRRRQPRARGPAATACRRPAAWTAPSSAPASASTASSSPRRELLHPAPPEAASPAPAPASPQTDIPDIPYLSTLIVPALRPPGTAPASSRAPHDDTRSP